MVKINDKIVYSETEVRHESSGGFIFYFDKSINKLFVALLETKDGAVVMPKGHVKENETNEETAFREISEELSLKTKPYLLGFLTDDNFSFKQEGDSRIHYKTVHIYVFYLESKEKIAPQIEEDFILAEWFPIDMALDIISFNKEQLMNAKIVFEENRIN